jgi:predicted RNase H-like nuclease (RuvC/YqgF family)
MIEKKGRGTRRSDRPVQVVAAELKGKRDAFLQTFFKRGAELTDELVSENKRLRDQIANLETENAALKTQLASDEAIRDLLRKIEQLEREKARLLSTVHRQEEITNRVTEIEAELESFANLYVASFQLHSSLRVRSVVRHVRELLEQLVGARSLAIYFVDEAARKLSPISAYGVDQATLPVIALHDAPAGDVAAATIEKAYLTGIPHVAEGEVMAPPAACIPLQLEDRVVGVVAIYTLLAQKKGFVTVDRELFKLVGAHAGGALVAAHLWGQTGGRLPTVEALREACA